MTGTHARLSASSSDRWMKCPGSVALMELMPEQEEEESFYAAEGTAAHALAEMCLKSGDDAWMHIGDLLYTSQDGTEYEATAEMAEYVQEYLRYVRERQDGCVLLIEQRVEDEALGENFGGTADVVLHKLVEPDETGNAGMIHVQDLKYGAGKEVDVEDNSQLRYYAYGVLRKLGITRDVTVSVGMTIVQPRAPSGNTIKEVWADNHDIIAWAEDELMPAMLKVDTPDAPLDLGDHCDWCPAKLICPKQRENFNDIATADPGKLKSMSDEDLGLECEKIMAAKGYIRAVKSEALRRALAGSPPPGTKLVAGRANRIWKPGAEDAMIEKFGDEAFNAPTPKSPAQIEKVVGGKTFTAEWCFKPEPQPMLASANDKRREVTASDGASVFKGV